MKSEIKSNKILLVEDNKADARLFAEYLADCDSCGFDLEIAETIEETSKILKQKLFQIIMLDLNLPDSNGVTTFETVKGISGKTPIVILTGLQDRELAELLVQKGAEDYLSKDQLNTEIIVRTIRFAIERSKIKNEIIEKEVNLNILVDKNPNSVIVLSMSGEVRFINAAGEKLLGRNADEILGQKFPIPLNKLSEQIVEIENPQEGIQYAQPQIVEATWSGKKSILLTLKDITDEIRSEEKFRTLFNLSPDILLIQDKNRNLIEVNQSAQKMLGYSREELLAFSIKSVLVENTPEDEKQVRDLLERDMQAIYERTLIGKNKHIPVEVHSTLIEYRGEIAVLSQARDITQRKLQERILRDSEEKYRLLTENITDAVWKMDTKLRFTYINPGVERLLQYKPEEMIGKPLWQFATKKDFIYMARYALAAIKNFRQYKPVVFESRMIRKDGTPLDVEITGDVTLTNDGKLLGVQGITRDISESKRAEKAEQKSRRTSEELFELTKMIDKSEDEIIDHVLKRSVQLLESSGGYICLFNAEKLQQKTFNFPKEILCKTDDEKDSDFSLWFECKKKGKPLLLNNNNFDNDLGILLNEHKIEKYLCVPVLDNGVVIAVCGIINKESDYTKDDAMTLSLFANEMWSLLMRKRSIFKIHKSEEQFRGFFENSPVGMYRTTPDGKILDANLSLLHTLGYNSLEDMISNQDVSNNYLDQKNKVFFDEIMRSEGVIYGFESQWFKKGGQVIEIRESAHTVFDENGKPLYYEGIAVDVTEEKRSEAERKEMEIRFRSIWENSFDGMRLTDKEGTIVDVNQAFCRLFEKEKKDFVGQPFFHLYLKKDEKSTEKFKKNYLSKNIKDNIHAEVNLWNGKKRWFSISNSFIEIAPEKNFLLSIFRDITESKEYEKELFIEKERAEAADKLKSEFLAKMSHEIRTPMNIINSTIELLSDDLEEYENETVDEYFSMMEDSSRRLIRTVDSILNMSLIQVGQYDIDPVLVDLENEIFGPLRREFDSVINSEKIEFRIVSPTKDSTVYSDVYCLYNVISNLTDNAIKFTDSGMVKIIAAEIDEDWLQISITDTGIGMSEEFMKSLFKPFEQEEHGYSRSYDGSGLGMAIVNAYCQLNKIGLNVETEKGIGTAFTLKIPKRSFVFENTEL